MPRVLTAAAVGAGLALCGVVMQALTRNPLADPYLLGLSSGASVGAVVVIVLGVGLLLPVRGVRRRARRPRRDARPRERGRARSPRRARCSPDSPCRAVFGAITSLVIFWSATGDSYREILNWLLGSLAGADWASVAIAGGARRGRRRPAARERPHARRLRVRRHRGGRPRRARRPQPRAAARRHRAAHRRARGGERRRSDSSGSSSRTPCGCSSARGTARCCRCRRSPARSSWCGPTRPRARCSIRASCPSASSRRSSAARCSRCSCCAIGGSHDRHAQLRLPACRPGALRPRTPAHHRRRRLHRARRAPSARCSARTAPARPRCCTSSPASSERMPGRRVSATATSPPCAAASAPGSSPSPSRRCRTPRACAVSEVVALGRTPYLGAFAGPGDARPRGRAALPRGCGARRSSPTASTRRSRAASASG